MRKTPSKNKSDEKDTETILMTLIKIRSSGLERKFESIFLLKYLRN